MMFYDAFVKFTANEPDLKGKIFMGVVNRGYRSYMIVWVVYPFRLKQKNFATEYTEKNESVENRVRNMPFSQ